jgi:hypothetical protein
MAGGLVWHILHPPTEAMSRGVTAGALPVASGELQADIKA